MRSFQWNLCLMAALTLVAAACGGDDGNGPTNQNPVAAFTFECDALACTFTDGSTDPDGNADIDSWDWDFGGDGTSEEQSPAHTFSAAGTYQVTLTVTDAAGASNTSAAQAVTVTTTPGNQAPTAAFTVSCSSLECSFTDGSADADGTIASYAWDFGDPTSSDNTSDLSDPTHTYSFSELTEVTVTLTVTDDDGDTGETTETFTVSPPAGLTCDGADCSLTLTADASVTVTLISSSCEASGNTFVILTPVLDTLFTDGCNTPVPGTPEATFQLENGQVFAAGTEITAEVISGLPNQGLTPTIRVTQGFPEWKLEFDDGFVGPEEPTPDFNDLVFTVTATTP
jgi:PKD repeat protein